METIITLKVTLNSAEVKSLKMLQKRKGAPLYTHMNEAISAEVPLNTLQEKGLVRQQDGAWTLTYLGMTANTHPEMN